VGEALAEGMRRPARPVSVQVRGDTKQFQARCGNSTKRRVGLRAVTVDTFFERRES
jgi:hypothetical protein